MKKKILIGIIAIIMCFICFSMWILSGIGNTYYYVQIDNSKIEQINSSGGVIDFNGGMSYFLTTRMEREKILHLEHQEN